MSSAKNPPFDLEKRAPHDFDWTKGLPTDQDDPGMNSDPFGTPVPEVEEGDLIRKERREKFARVIFTLIIWALIFVFIRLLVRFVGAAF